jgi:nicotinate-nucleotide pyrophosphorylase (carboxylating)
LATIPADQESHGARRGPRAGVVAGVPVVAEVFAAVADLIGCAALMSTCWSPTAPPSCAVTWSPRVSGPVRAILIGERTMLNIVSSALRGRHPHPPLGRPAWTGPARWCWTRARRRRGCGHLEKYAVRAGGGTNKRMGLYDVAMIKDNHKIAAGGLTARRTPPCAAPSPTSTSRSR